MLKISCITLPKEHKLKRKEDDATTLTRFAEAVDLDMEQYAHDMIQQSYLPRIEEDVEGGERSGVQGTPTFFINGVLYRGSWEKEALLAVLEAASRGS